MIRPNIKGYHRDIFDHWVAPIIDRSHFMNRKPQDVRWLRSEPPVNIKHEGTIFEMEIALPGFKKNELDIKIKNDVLTIRAEKEVERPHVSSYVMKEFGAERVERKFKLAEGIGREKITAVYRDGILYLTFIDVSLEEETGTKKVTIE